MKHKLIFVTLLLCALCLPEVYAVTILECVDEAGNSTFQDRCPPGSTAASQRDIRTGAGEDEEKEPAKEPEEEKSTGSATITLYMTSTDCDACVVVKSILGQYGASFAEKDVSKDMAARQELQEKAGGTGSPVSLPTVFINDQIISGFNKEALSKALEDAGYTKGGAAAAAPAPETK